MNNWILIADKSSTKIYNCSKEHPRPVMMAEIENKDAKAYESEYTSDRRGRRTSALSSSSFGRKDTAKTKNICDYTHIISDYIKSNLNKHQFDELIVVAAPELLGEIRSEFNRNKIKILKTIPKDLHELNEQTLYTRLRSDILDSFPV